MSTKGKQRFGVLVVIVRVCVKCRKCDADLGTSVERTRRNLTSNGVAGLRMNIVHRSYSAFNAINDTTNRAKVVIAFVEVVTFNFNGILFSGIESGGQKSVNVTRASGVVLLETSARSVNTNGAGQKLGSPVDGQMRNNGDVASVKKDGHRSGGGLSISA